MKTENKKIKIGVFGFGVVGQGLYEVLDRTPGISAEIKKICIKNPDKERSIADHYFTTDPNDILEDPEIDIVVELINDTAAALQIVTQAMKNKKAVVSASKKMIAENLRTLYDLQQENGVSFLYEAACCASIPVIRNLEEYYDNDLLNGIEGICNGSSNYILTKVFEEGMDFETALKQAQEKGFAETDPTMDIEGFDSKYKTGILLLHTFGIFSKPEDILHFGISRLNQFDIDFVNQQNKKIKLISVCKNVDGKATVFVLPLLINKDHLLADVANEYNGVMVESTFLENQFFIGKGAGGTATGSAVLSDISALTYGYKYGYKKIKQHNITEISDRQIFKVYVRYQDENQIQFSDFEDIEIKYRSPENRYIIGRISLAQLKEAAWLKDEEVNLLVFRD